MTGPDDRLDDLLEDVLAAGTPPHPSSPAGAAALDDALRAAAVLRAARDVAEAEAAASQPTARARFERYLDAARPAAAARPRPSAWRRPSALPRLAWPALAAAVAVVVAVAALVLPRLSGDGVQTASAQVIEPGDYVQLQGVVRDDAGPDDGFVLETTFGVVDVIVTGLPDPADAAAPRPGDAVEVAGIAQSTHSIRATTLARSTVATAVVGDIERLAAGAAALDGRVLSFALSADGTTGKVLLETPDGRHVLAQLDGDGAERLLRLATALGAEVRITATTGPAFSVEVTRPAADRPGLLRTAGVVRSRDGSTLDVETPNGTVQVELTPATRIVVGQSGLTRPVVRRGQAIVGHSIAFSGARAAASGPILADVVVVGQARTP